jgi:hypothetical protein
MTGRNTHIQNFVRSKLPKSRKAGAALSAVLFAVLGTVVLTGLHSAIGGSGIPLSGARGKAVKSAVGLGSPQVASSPQVVGSSPATSSSAAIRSSHVAGSSLAATASPAADSSPVAGGSYAGSLVLNVTGSRLVSWNRTSTYCPGESWQVPDGTVSVDSSGDATLGTTGALGSCVALISPGSYSSGVIEASIDFPALPNNSRDIADWTSFWLTDQATWPADGEVDAVEFEPNTGLNAVTYHWGTSQSPLKISTDGSTTEGVLPIEGPNLTPGWHVVDIVYAKGFFEVYYDGIQYTSLSNSVVTGSALNILITSSVTPDTSAIEQQLGGPPINSDSSPAILAVKYVKVWSFK